MENNKINTGYSWWDIYDQMYQDAWDEKHLPNREKKLIILNTLDASMTHEAIKQHKHLHYQNSEYIIERDTKIINLN